MQRVMCTSVWNKKFKTKEGLDAEVVCCKFSTSGSSGMFEYPFYFQMPKDCGIVPEVSKFYDCDFHFGYFFKPEDFTLPNGEVVERKVQNPTWNLKEIRAVKL